MNIRSQRRRRLAGITLLEVLVVIVIMGILAALILPAVAQKGKATQIVCVSNQRQILVLINHYVQDESGGYPLATFDFPWQSQLDAYNKEPRILRCPEPVKPTKEAMEHLNLGPGPVRPFIGYNAWGTTRKAPFPESNLGFGGNATRVRSVVTWRPSRETPQTEGTIVIGDCPIVVGVRDAFQEKSDYARLLHAIFPDVVGERSVPAVGSSHAGKANMGFGDGHVVAKKALAWIANSDEAKAEWNRDGNAHREGWAEP